MPERNSFRLSSLAALVALTTACGGGGGSSATDTSTVSGTAESPGGTSVGELDWLDRGQELVAGVIGPAHAAVSGLAAVPEDTPVALVRLNMDGTTAETLAQGETGPGGEFTLETEAEIDGSVVVRVGTGDDSLRGPANEEDSRVNPVSEAVIRNVVSSVSSGDSSFDDFSGDEVQSIVDNVEESSDADFSGASVGDSVEQVEQDSGERIASNVDAAANDDAGPFAGDKHLAKLQGSLDVTDPEQATFEARTAFQSLDVTDDGSFDQAGVSIEAQRITREWDLGADVGESFDSGSTSVSIPSDRSPSDLLLRDDGTFRGRLGADRLKGVRAGDGDVFAAVTGDALWLGAAQRESTPNDFAGSFNLVAFTLYTDQSTDDNDDQNDFRPGQVGAQVRQRAQATFNCTDGTCDIAIDEEIAASDEKTFVQSGADPTVATASGPSPQGNFTITDVELADNGSLDGSAELRASGFVAPGGELATFAISGLGANVGLSGGFPYTTQYIGVPVGQSCDNSVLSGTYEVVELGSAHRDNADTGEAFREIDRQSVRYTADADRSGSITVSDVTGAVTALDFNESSGNATADLAQESAPSIADASYSVATDCTFTAGEFTGAVSPDGEIVVATSSTVGSSFVPDSSGADHSVVIALRQSQ